MSLRRSLVVGGIMLAALSSPALSQRCVVAEVEVPTLQLRVGAKEQVLVIFRDAAGIPCDVDPPFTITSSNPNVVRIERITQAVGIAPGAAAVTVRVGRGKTARSGVGAVVVTASDPVAETAVVAPVAPSPAPVSAPRGPGHATLLYQAPGSGDPVGIIATPAQLLMLPGEARGLSYQTADVTGQPAEALPLMFLVEPAAARRFVQVDSIGIVTATDTGTATIRVTAPGRPRVRSALVSVTVRADSVTFSVRAIVMTPGTTDTVRLRIPAQDRLVAMGHVYRFASSDTSVARVHLFQPVVEARAPGVAVITATNPRLPPVTLRVTVRAP